MSSIRDICGMSYNFLKLIAKIDFHNRYVYAHVCAGVYGYECRNHTSNQMFFFF